MKAMHEVDDRVVRASTTLPTFIGRVTSVFLFADLHRVREYLPELTKQGFDYTAIANHFDSVDYDWRESAIYVVEVEEFVGETADYPLKETTFICCEAELLTYQES
jgi:hypothetical protein